MPEVKQKRQKAVLAGQGSFGYKAKNGGVCPVEARSGDVEGTQR